MTDAKPTEPRNAVAIIANTIRAADMQAALRTSLPPDVALDKFTSATIEAIKRRPDLFEDADRQSLYNAIVEAARDGLSPDGKQGALVPFNTKSGNTWVKKVQWMIMPEGIIDKLAKLGVSCYAVSVYANDNIRVWYDDIGQHVEHEPVMFGERGGRVGAYACARTKNGVTYVEAMSMEDLEVPRRASKSKDQKGELIGPWRDVPDRMEQKSCLHRLCKRVPNVDIQDDPDPDADAPGIKVVTADKRREPYDTQDTTRPRALQAVVDTQPNPHDHGMRGPQPAADPVVTDPPPPEIF